MTLTGDVLAAESRTELLMPMYLYLLLWFFAYCYPIARATVALERRFQVNADDADAAWTPDQPLVAHRRRAQVVRRRRRAQRRLAST